MLERKARAVNPDTPRGVLELRTVFERFQTKTGRSYDGFPRLGLFVGQNRQSRDIKDQAERRLRPRALRAAITLRPPTVAMRARKPWRRLRTSLLG